MLNNYIWHRCAIFSTASFRVDSQFQTLSFSANKMSKRGMLFCQFIDINLKHPLILLVIVYIFNVICLLRMCNCNYSESFWQGRGGTAGGKFRISLGLPVGAVMNCADNTGYYYSFLCFFIKAFVGMLILFYYQAQRTCTSLQFMVLKVVLTACLLLVLETCLLPQWRRVNLSWGRKVIY